MKSLSSKLAELTAFDQLTKPGTQYWIGAKEEHARLAPYLALLGECADALNKMRNGSGFWNEYTDAAGDMAEEVLSKLQALVDGGGK